jgi:hypothetical protein
MKAAKCFAWKAKASRDLQAKLQRPRDTEWTCGFEWVSLCLNSTCMQIAGYS